MINFCLNVSLSDYDYRLFIKMGINNTIIKEIA